MLHQEPSASEAISPRVAKPYIQALHSINLDGLPEKEEDDEEEQQRREEKELAGKQTTEDNQESESQTTEEPSQIEELNAVMEQVAFCDITPKNK